MVDEHTLLDVALDALAHGFAVLPVREDGSKAPDAKWTEYQHRLPTEDEVRSWYSIPRTGIGIVTGKVSGNLEMLEFEGRAITESITEQFVDLAAKAGLTELVTRVNSGYCEATPSGGLHLLYRVSDGAVAGNTKLARRPATPAELADKPDDPVRVLIETRGEGGYVVVAPSHGAVHATGNEWLLLNGGFDQVALITAQERDELHHIARILDAMPAPAAPTRAPLPPSSGDGDRPGDAYNNDPHAADRTLQLLERHGWAEVFRRPHDGHQDVHLRRPGKQIGTSAVLHMDAGTLVNFSTSVAAFDTEVGYTPFSIYTTLEHGGDYQAAARQLRPSTRDDDMSAFITQSSTIAAPAAESGTPSPALQLPEQFWTARPALEHIRQAARSRLVAPDALLGATLARVAAITPFSVEIPAVIGTAMGLTFFAALVGPPGTGKSAAANLAGEILPAPDHIVDKQPIGSGEGFVDLLFDWVEEDTGGRKKTKVKRQTKYAAIINIDEGQVLTDLGARQGSTLLPTLRTAFTHGTLGSANASNERKRVVDGRKYVYGVTMGIQPDKAAPLLADAAGGTPQRFIWLSAVDPDAAGGHAYPGELPWSPPDRGNLDAIRVIRGGYERYPLDLHDKIAQQLIDDRLAVQRGEPRAAGTEHAMLVRLKVAALLTLLDRRLAIDIDDWELAGTIIDTSHRVRRSIEHTIALTEDAKERAGLERHARRELHVQDSVERRALASAARSIANVVQKHHDDGRHNLPAGCVRKCLHRAIAGPHRAVLGGADPAIDEALERGFIIESDGRFVPGDARPA